MAVTVATKARMDERRLLMRQLREDWWKLHRAAGAKRPDAVIWQLQQIEQTKRTHNLTLAEMLVASGCVR